MRLTKKLNFFHKYYGTSNYFSPRMIFHEGNLDCSKHLKFVLEEHAQALNELKESNTNAPRVLITCFASECCKARWVQIFASACKQKNHPKENLMHASYKKHHRQS